MKESGMKMKTGSGRKRRRRPLLNLMGSEMLINLLTQKEKLILS